MRADYGSVMAKADPARDERLAAALRENLRKRKEQARAVPASEQPKSD